MVGFRCFTGENTIYWVTDYRITPVQYTASMWLPSPRMQRGFSGQIAQLVEHEPEELGVLGSIPSLSIRRDSQVVRQESAKLPPMVRVHLSPSLQEA